MWPVNYAIGREPRSLDGRGDAPIEFGHERRVLGRDTTRPSETVA